MAFINTLRNKMGKAVVAFIAIAIISFTLNDILGSNSILFQSNDVGKIAGESISINEFQEAVKLRELNYSVFMGRQPVESDKANINNEAWLRLINEYAYGREYDKLGITVTEDELWDIIQGRNQDETIRQFFTDPNTGVFDVNTLNTFLNNPSQVNPQSLMVWDVVYSNIEPSRKRLKYDNLMLKSEYATEAEGKFEYHNQSDIAEVRYVYVPYYSVSEQEIEGKVTEDMLKDYYNKHKNKYRTEHLKSLDYVTFPVIPSKEDTADVRNEMMEIITEFKTVENDSLFASSVAESADFYANYHRGNLPFRLTLMMDSLKKGDIIGPFLEGAGLKTYKVSNIYNDSLGYAKASHILIRWSDTSDEAKAEAKKEAQRILDEIKGGETFASMARQYGTDGTASNGGDLGWFRSGDMVEEFNDAVFNAKNTGLINEIIETQFGYHLIDVTETKTTKTYSVASVDRTIIASDYTRNEAYRKAEQFATSVKNLEDFTNTAKKDSILVQSAENLKSLDRYIGMLGDSRVLIQWLFRDADTGDVSELYEIDDNYVVAVMTDEVEKGIMPFEKAKSQIENKVKNEVRAKIIREKLSGVDSKDLEALAAAGGEEAHVYTTSTLTMYSANLPNVGVEPVAVGKVFAMTAGSVSEPINGESGVLVLELTALTKAPEIADYSSYKDQVRQRRTSGVSSSIAKVVEKYADIEDKRYKVY